MNLCGKLFVLFVQGNPLGGKSAFFSRLNCVLFVQETVIPFKRRLLRVIIFVVLVAVVLCDYAESFDECLI